MVNAANAEFLEYLESFYIEEEGAYSEEYDQINKDVTFKAIG